MKLSLKYFSSGGFLILSSLIFTPIALYAKDKEKKIEEAVISYKARFNYEVPRKLTLADCQKKPKLKETLKLSFSSRTLLFELPNGKSAAAICLQTVEAANILKIIADKDGGPTIHNVITAAPAIVTLDNELKMISDYGVKPYMFVTGLVKAGPTALIATRTPRKVSYVLLYVSDESINGGRINVRVDDFVGVVPIPLTPNGEFDASFVINKRINL